MAQLAARYEMVDLTSREVGDTQILSDGRYLARLVVTINYDRKGGIERRHAIRALTARLGNRLDAGGCHRVMAD